MCSPARVIDRYGADVADRFGIPYVYNQPGPGGVYLGSVGDQAHASRTSSHNCAPNSQESPVNGVSYHPNFAHAWDARPATHEIGMAMVRETLADPRVRYINFADVRYFPDGRTEYTDHPTFHVSMLPGTHDDTRPFFTDQSDELSEAEVEAIVKAIKAASGAEIKTMQAQGRLNRGVARRQGALTRIAIAKAAGGDDPEAAKELALADAEITAAEKF